MEEAAYRLSWDLSHFEKYDIEETSDLSFVEFGGCDKFAIYRTENFSAPNPLIYSGYPPSVKGIDFPLTDNDWTIVSPQMYEILISVGDFPHRALPTAAIDCEVHPDKRFKPDGRLRPEIIISEFITVHLTEHLPIFDFEKSIYTRPSKNLPDLLEVDEYVFKIPTQGLPPLFRIAADPTPLFISREARENLKAALISGTRYISLKGFSANGGDTIDVPVTLPLLENSTQFNSGSENN